MNPIADLLPTYEPGRCYQQALEMLIVYDMLAQVQRGRGITASAWLVHGIAKLAVAPFVAYAHAWVEVDGTGEPLAFDHKMPDRPIARSSYYSVGQVDRASVKRYTLAQASRLAVRHGSYGPWDETIAAATHADDVELSPNAG